MEENRAYGVTISLYNNQINQIRHHVKHSKKFKTEAAFFQSMVDEYFKKDKKKVIGTFLMYLGYPMVIMSLMLYVATSTDTINIKLMEKGFFFSDLTYLANTFFLIGFAFIGITLASFYVLWSKIRER
jgi:hypothetical protein